MNRKNFIANTLMALAATLVPRVLQPVIPKVSGVTKQFNYISMEYPPDLDEIIKKYAPSNFYWNYFERNTPYRYDTKVL